jgi:hypothetical protein
MKSRRFALLCTAALSLTGSAAFAQGWDDPQADVAARQQAEAAAAHQAQIQQRGTDQRSALQRATDLINNYDKIPDANAPQPKWRMVPDANGHPMLIEDTRGAAPNFNGGFGKVDQNAQNTNGLAPLTPEMLRMHMQQSGGPGSNMFETIGGNGFFGGIKPIGNDVEINQSELQVQGKDTGPAWAKDRIDNMHHYVDGQEHHGAEDPHGFF